MNSLCLIHENCNFTSHTEISFPFLVIGCFISSFLFCSEILKDGDLGLIAEQGCHLSASMCHITCYGDIGQLFTANFVTHKTYMQHFRSITEVLPLPGSLYGPSDITSVPPSHVVGLHEHQVS